MPEKPERAPLFDEVAEAAAPETLDAPEATTALAEPLEELEPDADPDTEPVAEAEDAEPLEEALTAPVTWAIVPLTPSEERAIPLPIEV